ncbi:hypothetical protein JF66_09605 [Cryobacterium sp. MLB-32]|uniref:copper chaperone PCu(A)C n=1 Tax=Cryobacterium sp. MLB-32 TaxID=1529318 RepID=UPI0004E78A5A|nr:copper chaperone PCu(A)C [Cryobacterium sp. MLB-32]KFF59699.1 hypothetical protein JF66_09605 [Cryobacterium sp. MLB-32]
MTLATAPRILVIAVAALLTLSGCAITADTAVETTAPAADSLNITDPWVKAAESGMSAGFGTIENSGDTDITIVSATTEAASMVQLHETVTNASGATVMQQKEGGFVVPAGGTFELAPGSNHLMMMDLTAPLMAGDEVPFTLTLSDGSTYEFTAPAKDYAGANETYEGNMKMDTTT